MVDKKKGKSSKGTASRFSSRPVGRGNRFDTPDKRYPNYEVVYHEVMNFVEEKKGFESIWYRAVYPFEGRDVELSPPLKDEPNVITVFHYGEE